MDFISSFFLGFFVLGVAIFNNTLEYIITLSILGGITTSLIFYLFSRKSVIIMQEDGIIFNNIKIIRQVNKTVSRRKFIKWENISKLNFKNKYLTGGRFSALFKFLTIKTDKTEYLARINDSSGFISTLKLINKTNLLSKDAIKII